MSRDASTRPGSEDRRVSRGRNLLGKLLALACLGAVLVPSVSGAKTTKRSSRPRRVAKAGRGAASHEPPKGAKRQPVAQHATRHRRRARHGGRGLVDEHVHVRRGDTLESLLAARGVGIVDALDWINATADVYDLRRIRPRHGLTLQFDSAIAAYETRHPDLAPAA
jgi:hypothetical protein